MAHDMTSNYALNQIHAFESNSYNQIRRKKKGGWGGGGLSRFRNTGE